MRTAVVAGFGTRLENQNHDRSAPFQPRVGFRHFPRRTLGGWADLLPKVDEGWDHHDVVDLTDRRRYDHGWVI